MGVARLADIVQFVSARDRDLRAAAQQLIEELGPRAGYEVGLFARLPSLAEDARDRLLAVADIIEQEQGYGCYFANLPRI